ncbi:minor capsid protein [Paenibacillus alvei]|uniref:minor capsid protein n=1 Tax=Paenibacillus alvei TaxID=44250 RepID=UPI002280D6F4|nr:minor capsid protein [Paenibacillus alvei]MCY9734168.1 minor capsid protein [Paenibacillus alvei]
MTLMLSEIRDWMKTQIQSPNWYIGKIDGSKPECIGLYNINTGRSPYIAIGGLDNTSYATKAVSILVHWSKNADKAERKAHEVYASLFGRGDVEISGHRVITFDMRTPEPVSVGTDDEGIYEYVIETTIYYER